MNSILKSTMVCLGWGAGLASVLCILVSPSVLASAPGAIAQSYETDSKDVTQGALLSVAASGSTSVEPASVSNASNLVGVAVSKPLIELSNSTQGSVQVVVGGTAEALVSDINGTVKVGDKITTSPLAGIGMKATHAVQIVGVAQANLQTVKTVSESVSGTDGKKVSIKVGLLPLAVNVSYYSAGAAEGDASSFVPPFLQSIANSLTGKQVSPMRVLLGGSALILGFITVISMLYVAIRSGVISIGRNPLAERALRKGLVDVILAALGVLAITVVIVAAVLFS